ncbi:MAG: FHA domain-containing protein [Myxococcales bacterium]
MPRHQEEDWGAPATAGVADATRIAPVPREAPAPVQDDNATCAGPPITLEVIDGPDSGLRLPVRGGRMIIGRGEGCDFKLKDAAASRRHAELVASPSGLVVRDLGSGNGTRVNGERVSEAAVLHGDTIAVGQTLLRVIDDLKQFEEERRPKAAPPRPGPRAAPPAGPRRSTPPIARPGDYEDDEDEVSGTARMSLPSRDKGLLGKLKALPPPMRYGILGGGGLLVLLLLLAIAGALKGPPPPPPGPPPEELEYEALFEEGKKNLRAAKYEDALASFRAAQAVIDKPELARYIEACERDAKASRQVLDAKSLAARGELAEAIEVLKGIEELAGVYEEAKELIKTYEADRIAAVKRQIETLLQDADVEGARELLAELPESQQPVVRGQIEKAELALEQAQAEQARRERERAAQAKVKRIRKARREVDEAIAGVVRKMNSGNFEGALRELDRVMDNARSKHVVKKVRDLRVLIPKFSSAYREGVSKYNGGAYEAAAKPLLRALTYWEDMDIEGNLGASLQQKVAKSMEMYGRASMARQEYGTAAKAFRQAIRFNPKAFEAKAALQEIARKAKDVYLQGYVEKDRNPDMARAKFRQVLDMVPPDHEVYQDAKKRLDDLAQR